MRLEEATPIAEALREALRPACERVEVAGSIRREMPEVGDVELVCLPKMVEVQVTLDGAGPREPATTKRMEALIGEGVLAHAPPEKGGRRAPFGPRYMKVVHSKSGMQADVFCVVQPAQWGVIYLIRTGSAAYTKEFVTHLRRRGFRCDQGHIERRVRTLSHTGQWNETWEAVPTPEEEDVFRVAKRTYLPPQERR